MSKRLESDDVFAVDDWLGDVIDTQSRLRSVTNPYRGNKRKILTDLAGVLRDHNIQIKGSKVLDLFSGSAFVSYFLKSQGAAVWSNDLLAFSYLGAVSMVSSCRNYATEEGIHKLIWDDPGDAGTFIRDKYSKRFTGDEAKRLDIICRNLELKYPDVLFGKTSIRRAVEMTDTSIHDFARDTSERISEGMYGSFCFAQEVTSILHYVMRNCDLGGRLNNGQVVAEVNHRLQRQKMSFHRVLPYRIAFDNGLQSFASNRDAITLLEFFNEWNNYLPKFDFVYIDPPYGGDQSDYAHMYGIFEDFLGYADKHDKEYTKRFTKSKTYKQNFEELLEKLPTCPWVFSYNDSSWADVDEIKKTIEAFDRRVYLHEVYYEYKYRAKEKSSGTEYLIVALSGRIQVG